MVLAALALGSLVIFALLGATSTAARVGAQDTEQVVELYAAESGIASVFADLLQGADALAPGYEPPTSTASGLDVELSVSAPVPSTPPEPVYRYADPGAGFGLRSLDPQTHYYFRMDGVQAGSHVRVNWAFMPPDGRWAIRLYEGTGPVDVPGPVQIAEDDFESRGLAGGSGWLDDWTASGDARVVPNDGPYQGNRHLRLRRASGRARRAVDLSGHSGARVRFWAKARSFEAGETATLSVSPDNVDYAVVRTWRNGDDDNVYRFEDIDLSSFGTSTEFWISFDANMSSRWDYFYVDSLEVVSQPFSSALAESRGVGGPGVLSVNGALIDGGTYTIDFFNASASQLASAPFGASGSEDETWVYVQAHKDYVVSAIAGDTGVTAYLRQVPGPTEPVTGQSVYVVSWRDYVESNAAEDADGDGIEDAVDGRQTQAGFVDESQTPSDAFTDQHAGGASFGRIDDRGGLSMTIRDAPSPKGLLLWVEGGPGTATVDACDVALQLTEGDAAMVTCDSALIEGHSGTVELLLDEDVVVRLRPGVRLSAVALSPERFRIENRASSKRSVAVEVGEGDLVTVIVPPGTTAIITREPRGRVRVENAPESLGAVLLEVRGSQTRIGAGHEHTAITPIGHWRFDSGRGRTVRDSSGGAHGGTMRNMGDSAWSANTPLRGRRRGHSLRFDGHDDVIDVGRQLAEGTRQLSVAAWVLKQVDGEDADDDAEQAIVCKSTGLSDSAHRFCVGVAGSKIRVRLRTSNNGGTSHYDGGRISSGEWVNVAFTYDGSTLRIFRNGEETTSYGVTGTIAASSQPVTIGNVNLVDRRHWRGLIDDVRIYAGALTPNEVWSLAGSPSAPPSSESDGSDDEDDDNGDDGDDGNDGNDGDDDDDGGEDDDDDDD